MKRLEFESASQAINHLKKLGGKRVEWTRITTGWHGSRRAAGRFVTRRRSFNNGFQTYPIGNVRV